MSNDQIVILFDYTYTIPPNGPKITLFSGENYRVLEKKSDNWLRIISNINKNDIYYVPLSYVEFISNDKQNQEYNSLKEKAPHLPVKPKYLFEKLQNEVVTFKSESPIISKEALKELYFFLKEQSVSDSFSDSPPVNEEPPASLLNNFPSTESFEIFNKDDEQNLIELHPTIGDIPLKIFDDGVEMYLDKDTNQAYYYDRKENLSSWTYPQTIAIAPLTQSNPISSTAKLHNDNHNQIEKNFNGLSVFMPVEQEESDIQDHPRKMDESRPTYLEKTEIITKNGYLNRTKIKDTGKKIKKNWNTVYTVLIGHALFFYKDQKASLNKAKHEIIIDLNNAFVAQGNSTRSSRPNLIQLICGNGEEYLLQSSNAEEMSEWFQLITSKSTNDNLNTNQNSEASDNLAPLPISRVKSPEIKKKNRQAKKDKEQHELTEASSESNLSMIGVDKFRFSDRLKQWLLRRPSKESLREKGIYKTETIFGSNLLTICEKEKSTIPKFVVDCITAVETRGLMVDGVYRVSGNMAEVQKLRYAINQNTYVNLLNPELDIHIITGSLKLFFRELSEPLFPFKTFNLFLKAFAETDIQLKYQLIKDAISQMPLVNKSTAKLLFKHLLLCVKNSKENRMYYQNISIVFGPTLMWPEEKSPATDLAVSMVMRGQLVETILKNFSFFFG